MKHPTKHYVVWATLAAGFGASSCWVVAGTGDFTDETGGTGAAATGGTGPGGGATGGSGATSTGGSGTGALGGGGAATGGTGGDGGQGGSPCPVGTGKLNGACCNDFGECSSTFCVDGVCCNTICADTCDSCSKGPTVGLCADACQTVTFGHNGADTYQNTTIDTFLHEQNPTFNYGGQSFVAVEATNNNADRHALIRFEVSALPAGSSIEEATMHLEVANSSALSHAVYEVLEEWQENTQFGEAGAANWTVRTSVGNTPWMTAGAGPGSSDPTPLTTFTPATPNANIAIGINPAVVQQWLDSPMTNHGLTIRSQGMGDSFEFYSSEGGLEGDRPYLEVQYIAP